MKRVLLMTVAGIVLASNAMAGMENCRFAVHLKGKFTPTKTVTTLCPNLASPLTTPNYSPNWNSTTTTPNPLPCSQYTTVGPVNAVSTPLAGSVVYVVIGKAGTEGVAGASFGVHYLHATPSGIAPQFTTFTFCSDGLSFANNDGVNPDFPGQNGGVRVTWNTANGCPAGTQQVIGNDGAHAVVGSFYIYSYGPDQLSITGNNNLQGGIPELAVANCAGAQVDLYQIWGPAIYLQLCGRVDIGGGPGYNPCLATPIGTSTWGKIKTKYTTKSE